MVGWAHAARGSTAVLVLFVLGACAQTQLAVHVIKEVQKRGDGQEKAAGIAPNGVPIGAGGAYKVGTPYVIQGVRYFPEVDGDYDETGVASWYGPGFHTKMTANGETYDQNDLTAAHRTLPMPSYVRVTNLENGRAIVLRVNDRGPYAHGRVIDVSKRAAQLLGFEEQGTAKVRVRIVDQGTSGFVADKPVTTQEERDAVSAVPVAIVESSKLAPPPGVAAAPAQVELAAPPAQVVVVSVGPSDLYVQAGAFSLYDNANQLAARLISFGEVSIQSAIVGETEFFRVRVGPLRSIEQADGVLADLIESGFLESRIIVGAR
jgi:rare lipoprotein A